MARIALLLVILLASPFAAAEENYTILVVNDDGYDTPGIRALARAMSELGEVTIVGPKSNASGVGHGITYKRAIDYKRVEDEGSIPVYWVDALPSSCTRWALDNLYPDKKPDLVVSGINRGMNVGMGVYYSGTVAAAREATFAGVPAMAISADSSDKIDYESAARVAVDHARKQLANWRFFFHNINVPSGIIDSNTEVVYTRLTNVRWQQEYHKRVNPQNGQTYFWITMIDRQVAEAGTDQAVVSAGKISITPLVVDATDGRELERLQEEGSESEKLNEPSPVYEWWKQ